MRCLGRDGQAAPLDRHGVSWWCKGLADWVDRSQSDLGLEGENEAQRGVDLAQFSECQVTDRLAESLRIDRSGLLHEHARCPTCHAHLRTESGCPS